METKRFLDMLGLLQAIQCNATLHGITSFEVKTAYWRADPELGDEPDELAIFVTIFRTDSELDEDYARFEFTESRSEADWWRMLQNIKAFVGEE